MSVYLDYAATTPLSDAVQKSIIDHLTVFGNPSSLHRLGVESERKLKDVKKQIASVLNVRENELIFTSGGTESNNMAILGMNVPRTNAKYITTQTEHPSVLNAFKHLEKLGQTVVYLSVNDQGLIDLKDLEEALTPDTVLVSVMFINNETGTIQPISEIGQIIQTYNKQNRAQIKFHVDAVQAFGKLNINVETLQVDLMSISAHKIGGLKGTGVLVKRQTTTLRPLVFGGQQEFGIRPGTENLMGIISFGAAVVQTFPEMEEKWQHVSALKTNMIDVLKTMDEVFVNCETPSFSPYILNVSFMGVKAEVLLHALGSKGIYVATGSACSSKKKNFSHVLQALGYEEQRMAGTIRLSFSSSLSEASVAEAGEEIVNVAKSLKQIMNFKSRKK